MKIRFIKFAYHLRLLLLIGNKRPSHTQVTLQQIALFQNTLCRDISREELTKYHNSPHTKPHKSNSRGFQTFVLRGDLGGHSDDYLGLDRWFGLQLFYLQAEPG